jgi:hypothetical protein
VGLFVQLCECLVWVLSGLSFRFIKLCYPLDGIKTFGFPFGSTSFAFFFFTKGFRRKCLACKHAFEIKGHLNNFCYPLSTFHVDTFFFASPSSMFSKLFHCFYSTLMGVFERLLGLGSLECPKTFLVH